MVGPIHRTGPVEVRDVEFLRSITDRRIKITVPGPFTMTQQAQNDHYGDARTLALGYAEAVNEELRDLKAAGADVVQIDEPYLQARPEPAREYAIEAINRALEGVEGDTVLHTCFGYAHIVHDRLPGYPFLHELQGCAATHLSLEAAQPDLDPEVLRDVPDKVVVLGVLDLGDPAAETAEVVAGRIRRALTVLPPERLVVAPDCGMKYLSRELAFAKLKAMVEGDPPRRRRAAGVMTIGREPSRPVSGISQAYADRVEVRGRDLTGDLMGRLTFTEYVHLLLTGDEPTAEQRFFLDLLLVSIAEHGMMPTNVAARMTLAADPTALQAAVAAGILGAGPVVLGTSEECARLLADASARVRTGERPAVVAADAARAAHESGDRVPGFGHPVHRPVDPRAERILELADERGVSGEHVELARALRDAVAEEWGKPLPMNVALPIAAVMLDLGYPMSTVKAVPILARTAGLLAHLAEEQENPLGFFLAGKAEEAVAYEPPRAE